MFKFKNFKRKFLQSYTDKDPDKYNDGKGSSLSLNHVIPDKDQVILLTQWLHQLNREELVTFTDQNDIVILPGGRGDQAQQIFIHNRDVNAFMKEKARNYQTENDEGEIINMSDIAQILLKYRYVKEHSGQLSFVARTVALDSTELSWLVSIVRDAQPDSQTSETLVKLYDGKNTQVLHIPYKFMAPTTDARTVATYLFRNGQVRYDVDTGSYAYRYVEPDLLLDEKTKSPERLREHYVLSFHVRRIYVDEENERIELEFRQEPNHHLVLPKSWYQQIMAHQFDRDYIIDIILANGGIIDGDKFVFMDDTCVSQESRRFSTTLFSTPSMVLKVNNLSSKEKHNLISRYIDLIIENDCARQDNTTHLLALENPSDSKLLYFTSEHSKIIRKNHFQRQDAIHILNKHGQIKQDESGWWWLYYNNQYIKLPTSFVSSSVTSLEDIDNQNYSFDKQTSLNSISTAATSNDTEADNLERYHNIIDYMCRHGLVTWDKQSKLIKLHFTDQTLLIPISHLCSIIDPRVVSSSSTIDGVLPFTSRQLSEWLLNNSYIKRSATL